MVFNTTKKRGRSPLKEWKNFTDEHFSFVGEMEGGDELFTKVNDLITEQKEDPGFSLLQLYWEVGQQIVLYQKYSLDALYDNKKLREMAKLLTDKYGKGFSTRNIANMRRFYTFFQILQTPFNHTLTWSHYTEILKASTPGQVLFYKEQAELNHWSVRELRKQMNEEYYYRHTLFSAVI